MKTVVSNCGTPITPVLPVLCQCSNRQV